MARVNVTTFADDSGDLAPSTEFTVDGIAIPNNGRRFVLVENGSGSTVTVTEKANATIEGIVLGNRTTTVAAGARKRFGPWSSVFQQEDGVVHIDVSAATDVDWTAFEVTPK